MTGVGLRQLIMGPPLTCRDQDTTGEQLDVHLQAVGELIPKVYGDSEASQQAQMEFKKYLAMENDTDGIVCKRAALLFALAREKEVGDHFAAEERREQDGSTEPTYAQDMRERVLPFILPRFVRNSCQAPDAFVVLACVLNEMWSGERLGNWPRVFEEA